MPKFLTHQNYTITNVWYFELLSKISRKIKNSARLPGSGQPLVRVLAPSFLLATASLKVTEHGSTERDEDPLLRP